MVRKQRLSGNEIEGKRPFWAFLFTNREASKLGTSVRITQRSKAQGGFEDDVFSAGIHSLKAQR